MLKRLLGDNRREEIFVSKATLSEKLAALPDPLRGSFKPLGWNGAPARASAIPAPGAATVIVDNAADGP